MLFEETENQIEDILKPQELFSTCKSRNLTDGVSLLVGCRKDNPNKWEGQSLRFAKPKFSIASAKVWKREHFDGAASVVLAPMVLSHAEWTSIGKDTAVFHKRLLMEGKLWHPVVEEWIEFSKEDIQAFSTETNRFIETLGDKPPFPDTHVFTDNANMGHWFNFTVELDENGKSWLAADVEVPLEEHAKRIGKTIKRVSVFWDKDVTATNGEKFSHLIEHVCATSYPVQHSQENFQKLAVKDSSFILPVLLSKEEIPSEMMKTLVKSLGLKDTATEEEVLAAIAAKDEEITELSKKKDEPPKDKDESKTLEKLSSELEATKKELSTTKEQLTSVNEQVIDRRLLEIKKAVINARGIPVGKEALEKIRTMLSANQTEVVDLMVAEMTKSAVNADGIKIDNEHTLDKTQKTDEDKEKDVVATKVRGLARDGYKCKIAEDGLSFDITHNPYKKKE